MTTSVKDVAIITGPTAPELELTAARELAGYIQQLFGLIPQVSDWVPDGCDAVFLIGSPETNPAVAQAVGQWWPSLSEQGFVLRKLGNQELPALVAGGGSPVATLWAVYELVERYGVRYLLHEDILPSKTGPFHLPKVDETFEPIHQLRSWPLMKGLPHGPETWRLSDQQRFIKQLSKLKFNAVCLGLWPWHPFVHYAYGGVERSWATLNFGSLYHLDEESVGHERVPRDNWYYNPEFEGAETYQEMLQVGQRLITDIISYGQARGMRTGIAIQPLAFPAEFAPVLQDSMEEEQLGRLTVSERGPLTNPQHIGLVETVLKASLETYPQVDEMVLTLPEFPYAQEQVAQAWAAFDERAGLEPQYTLENLIAQAEQNYINSGGPPRAVRELKSGISMLHFFNYLFETTDLLEHAQSHNVELVMGSVANELLPLVHRLLWPQARFLTVLNYTASTAIRDLHLAEQVNTDELGASLVVSFHDDNIGPLPQMSTDSIQHLLDMTARCHWQGFYTRFWSVDELDPPTSYLARASWDNSVTPEMAYNDHAAYVYGQEAVRPFNLAMIQLEQMTAILDTEYMSLFFPIPDTMARHLEATEPMAAGLHQIRGILRRCRDIFARMLELPDGSAAKDANLRHWISRCEFGMALIDQLGQLKLAGCAWHAAVQASDEERRSHTQAFEQAVARALELGEQACWLLADHIRDDSDRGQLAAFNRFCLQDVREKADQLRKKLG